MKTLCFTILNLLIFSSFQAQAKTIYDLISSSEPKFSLELKELEDHSYEAKIYRIEKNADDCGLFYESSRLKLQNKGSEKVYSDDRMTLSQKENGKIRVSVDNGSLQKIEFSP